jgi:hypothetical protein
MRAILIDPEKQSLTEVQLATGDFREINKLIGCRSMTGGCRPLNGSLAVGFDTIDVSDDPLEEGEDPRFSRSTSAIRRHRTRSPGVGWRWASISRASPAICASGSRS